MPELSKTAWVTGGRFCRVIVLPLRPSIWETQSWVSAGQAAEELWNPKGSVTLKINDSAGRLKAVKDGNVAEYTVYTYDGNGNRTGITYPDGATEAYEYYQDNLLKKLTNKTVDGATQYAQEIVENVGYYEYNVWNQMTKSTSNNS